MPNYRTLAQAQEEYDAVRTAYLKTLAGESYSVSTGAGSRSLTRPNADTLRQHMLALEREIGQLSRNGVQVRGVTPVG